MDYAVIRNPLYQRNDAIDSTLGVQEARNNVIPDLFKFLYKIKWLSGMCGLNLIMDLTCMFECK